MAMRASGRENKASASISIGGRALSFVCNLLSLVGSQSIMTLGQTFAKVETVPTDILVHGIARREGKPMQDMLQALADAAVDCKVLQSLHARMGVAVTCGT